MGGAQCSLTACDNAHPEGHTGAALSTVAAPQQGSHAAADAAAAACLDLVPAAAWTVGLETKTVFCPSAHADLWQCPVLTALSWLSHGWLSHGFRGSLSWLSYGSCGSLAALSWLSCGSRGSQMASLCYEVLAHTVRPAPTAIPATCEDRTQVAKSSLPKECALPSWHQGVAISGGNHLYQIPSLWFPACLITSPSPLSPSLSVCHTFTHMHMLSCAQPESDGPPIEKRLQAIRSALAECTKRNDSAPDLEKVWPVLSMHMLACDCTGMERC